MASSSSSRQRRGRTSSSSTPQQGGPKISSPATRKETMQPRACLPLPRQCQGGPPSGTRGPPSSTSPPRCATRLGSGPSFRTVQRHRRGRASSRRRAARPTLCLTRARARRSRGRRSTWIGGRLRSSQTSLPRLHRRSPGAGMLPRRAMRDIRMGHNCKVTNWVPPDQYRPAWCLRVKHIWLATTPVCMLRSQPSLRQSPSTAGGSATTVDSPSLPLTTPLATRLAALSTSITPPRKPWPLLLIAIRELACLAFLPA